jgi:hypothetical protein
MTPSESVSGGKTALESMMCMTMALTNPSAAAALWRTQADRRVSQIEDPLAIELIADSVLKDYPYLAWWVNF